MEKFRANGFFLILSFCLFAVLTGICAAADTVINMGQENDIMSFDPHAQNDLGSASVIRHIYDTLLRTDPDNNIVPCLAESWRIIDDRTVEFKLRPGVKFHNGDPFTAEDVKFSIERQKKSPRQAYNVDMVESIEITDSLTCRIKLSAPETGVLLSSLTYYGSSIVGKNATEKIEGEGRTLNENPIGTGPYKFAFFRRNERVIIEKNNEYFGKIPANDRLILRIIPDASARTTALDTGEIDLLVNVDALDAETIRGNFALVLEDYESTWMELILLNNKKPPFDNRSVREAIAHLAQRQLIIQVAERGEASPLYSPMAAGAYGYTADVKHYDYNVKKAKELLAEGGYPKGFECKVYFFGDNRSRTAQVLQSLFKEAGIKLSFEQMERTAYYNLVGNGIHSMALGGIISAYDPDATFSPYFHSKSIGKTGNRFFYDSPAADALIDAAQQETDIKKRLQIYAELQKLIIDDAVMVPLYTLNGTIGRRATLDGLSLYTTGQHMYDQLRFRAE